MDPGEAFEYDLTVVRAALKYRRVTVEAMIQQAPKDDFGVGMVIDLLSRLYIGS